jgi:CubicO group peptidase (beta-lactamase class C family)
VARNARLPRRVHGLETREVTVPVAAVQGALDFESLFRAEYRSLCQALVLLVGDEFEAEEIAPETRVLERWDRVAAIDSPTRPIASPGGTSTDDLEARGGYLPSLAAVTALAASGAMASDSPSLARWWRALCAGEIVSQDTLTEMSAFDPDVSSFDGGYGLGMFNPAFGSAPAGGHQGELFGYLSWAACPPEDGAVVVVLSNRTVDELSFDLFYRPVGSFVDVLRST